MLVKKLFLAKTSNPFTPKSEEEFWNSIDKGIRQADAGILEDMDEAIDEISRELAI